MAPRRICRFESRDKTILHETLEQGVRKPRLDGRVRVPRGEPKRPGQSARRGIRTLTLHYGAGGFKPRLVGLRRALESVAIA